MYAALGRSWAVVLVRALVTGGAGLIGSHLVDLLLERGYDVRILDNLEPVTHPGQRLPKWVPLDDVEFMVGDVRSDDDVRIACTGADVVFHQAAFGGFAPDAAVKMADVNALGTARVLAAARRAGAGRVVVASSQAVYAHGRYLCSMCNPLVAVDGRRDVDAIERHGIWEQLCPRSHVLGWRSYQPCQEDQPVDPVTAYALSKLYAEKIALRSEDWGCPVVALRYALTYGPRQSVSNPYTGIASIFATRLLAGLPPVIYEDGQQTRDFTYVADVARANLLAAEDRDPYPVMNVGTGRATTVAGFAVTLGAALARAEAGTYRGPVEPSGTYRLQDARHVVTDPSRIAELGWRPEVALEDGLDRYAEWFLESGGGPAVDATEALELAGIVRRVPARPA